MFSITILHSECQVLQQVITMQRKTTRNTGALRATERPTQIQPPYEGKMPMQVAISSQEINIRKKAGIQE